MSNFIEYDDLYAFHPGYYVLEIIEDMKISHTEFAKRMGTTAKTLSLLLSGKTPMSNDLARKLSAMTGMSIDVWLNLQKEYDKKLMEIKRQSELDKQVDIARMIDYSFFEKVAGLPKTRDLRQRVINLCAYLHVSDLRMLEEDDILVNFRSGISSFSAKNFINARAWVQTAINIANGMDVNVPFDAKKLRDSLPEIRNMTVQKPEDFLPKLRSIFSGCGVRFVLLPALKNSGINGAVKWLKEREVILALNDRRRYADTFWFALFHEIKHVLQQKMTAVFLSPEKEEAVSLNSELEMEADRFAEDYLIPPEEYENFLKTSYASEKAICDFAKTLSIHPGIVVGRLQHHEKLPKNRCNHLKEKYTIVI